MKKYGIRKDRGTKKGLTRVFVGKNTPNVKSVDEGYQLLVRHILGIGLPKKKEKVSNEKV